MRKRKNLGNIIKACLSIIEEPIFILYYETKKEVADELLKSLDTPTCSYCLIENKDAIDKRNKKLSSDIKELIDNSSGLILAFNRFIREDDKFFKSIINYAGEAGTKTILTYADIDDLYEDYILLDPTTLLKRGAKIIRYLEKFEESVLVKVTGSRTDISFKMDPKRSWVIDSGIPSLGSFAQLPAGEIYTCPIEESINGRIEMERDKKTYWVELENGKVVDYSDSLKNRFIQHPELLYLSEWGIGVNQGVKRITGNGSIDEKKFGTTHFGFGDNYGLGKRPRVDEHFDLIVYEPVMIIDDVIRLKEGMWFLDNIISLNS